MPSTFIGLFAVCTTFSLAATFGAVGWTKLARELRRTRFVDAPKRKVR